MKQIEKRKKKEAVFMRKVANFDFPHHRIKKKKSANRANTLYNVITTHQARLSLASTKYKQAPDWMGGEEKSFLKKQEVPATVKFTNFAHLLNRSRGHNYVLYIFIQTYV